MDTDEQYSSIYNQNIIENLDQEFLNEFICLLHYFGRVTLSRCSNRRL